MIRLYCPGFTPAVDKVIPLSKEQSHHLKVCRYKTGDTVTLFDGISGEWSGVLQSEKEMRLQKQQRPPQPVEDVWLVQPLLSKERLMFSVEKATELGVAAICPVTTRYTQGGQLNVERMQAHVIEATQQCERTAPPELKSLVSLTQLLAQWDAKRVLYVAMERSDALPAEAVFKSSPAALLVGPEGGFSEEEKQALHACAFVRPFSLGKNILRSETASIASLAIWQALHGRKS